MSRSVVILGAGITGLSYAYYLKKYQPEVDFVLLEESSDVGGKITTSDFDDAIVEWGPRGVRPKGKGQNVLELVEELGLWDQLVFADDKAKKRYLYHDNRLRVVPHSILTFIRSPYSKLFVKAIFKDLAAKSFDGDESIAQFSDRHFGRGFRSLFVDSVVSGVWAGDVEKVSVAATLSRLKELEQSKGSIIKGLFSASKTVDDVKVFSKKYTSKALFSFKDGMQTLSKALFKSIGNAVVFDCKIQNIDFDNKIINIDGRDSVPFAQIVSTLPAYKLSEYVPSKLASLLNKVEYSPLALYNFKVPKSEFDFDGFGFLVPSKEQSPVLGMVANTNTFPDHGTNTSVVNTMMIGGARYSLDDLRVLDGVAVAKSFIEKVFPGKLLIEKEEYRLLEKAIPQYLVGHKDLVMQIESAAPEGLLVLGNFMYGVSIIDLISKSKELLK